MLLKSCGFPWMTCCFPKLRLTKTAHQLLAIPRSDRVDHTYNRHVVICAPSSASFSSPSWCLRGVQLEVEFKPDARPIFCKPRSVPFVMQEELAQAYDVGIARGIWTPTSFSDWGTPVIPVRKAAQTSNKPALRVLRQLLCNSQPSAGKASTPVATY